MVSRVKHWPFMACIEWIREYRERPVVSRMFTNLTFPDITIIR
jgi:hypothetical protein